MQCLLVLFVMSERLVADEVRAIIQAHPTITVTACINRYDALFDQDDPLEEEIFDRYLPRNADRKSRNLSCVYGG